MQASRFFQWNQLFRQMINVWSLKHIMVFYSSLFSALKALLQKKFWKRQSEPEKNEVYFIFWVWEIWLFLLEQIVHYNSVCNKWSALPR